MSGFVVIRREALDHHIVGGPERFHAWCWLIATACWKPTKFDINGKTITLERGQLCVSRHQLADAWNWSPSAVERFLTRLQTEQMIGRATGQGRSVITIRNYAKYQDLPKPTGQGTGQGSGQAADKQRTAKEPSNQVTIEPDGSIPPVVPHRDSDWIDLPDWLPAEPWNGWLEMRHDKRKWPTPRAVKLTIDKLTRWKAKGHDPGAILDTATENAWTTIYEPKDSPNGLPARQADLRGAAEPSRGQRPNRCLDMFIAAEAEIYSTEDSEPDIGTRPALRAVQ